ncbi:hypothetical protein BGZ63DRAFT_452224 [Mariannaea sp. PMI_226]|nr:hypothetical protein BGZ63DRAFT_452224 [Mariannaea sp. PMI_226]
MAHNQPSFQEIQMLGSLSYEDAARANVQIKGFNEGFKRLESQWFWDRSKYVRCSCSFSLHPYRPGEGISLRPLNGKSHNVRGFAISISAVTSDTKPEEAPLIQYGSRGLQGPQIQLTKIPLAVTPTVPMEQPLPTEHMFERIGFRRGTKIKAEIQLVLELWGNIGTQEDGQIDYIKITTCKSEQTTLRLRPQNSQINQQSQDRLQARGVTHKSTRTTLRWRSQKSRHRQINQQSQDRPPQARSATLGNQQHNPPRDDLNSSLQSSQHFDGPNVWNPDHQADSVSTTLHHSAITLSPDQQIWVLGAMYPSEMPQQFHPLQPYGTCPMPRAATTGMGFGYQQLQLMPSGGIMPQNLSSSPYEPTPVPPKGDGSDLQNDMNNHTLGGNTTSSANSQKEASCIVVSFDSCS